MPILYQQLLRLYPAEHRQRFAQEMCTVFEDARAEIRSRAAVARVLFYVREIAGLTKGALREHLRVLLPGHANLSFPTRRFTMQSGFRFPKSTPVLMTVILAGIILALEKARVIQTSFSHGNPPLVPMEAAHLTFFPTLALLLVIFYAGGLVGWAILFALRRSGVHRLDELGAAQK